MARQNANVSPHKMAPLIALLGQSLHSPLVKAWLAALPSTEPTTIDWSDEGEIHRFLQSKAAGVEIKHSDEGDIDTIFLMSEGKDGFAQFRGDLGEGLVFSSSPEDVMRALGKPSFRRPAGLGLLNLRHGEIMRYDYPEHSVAFQFREEGLGIEQVTLMTAATVPGRARAS
jgi:hypothetical protein